MTEHFTIKRRTYFYFQFTTIELVPSFEISMPSRKGRRHFLSDDTEILVRKPFIFHTSRQTTFVKFDIAIWWNKKNIVVNFRCWEMFYLCTVYEKREMTFFFYGVFLCRLFERGIYVKWNPWNLTLVLRPWDRNEIEECIQRRCFISFWQNGMFRNCVSFNSKKNIFIIFI